MATRWRIVALLLTATMINYIDRVNLSFAAPIFMRDHGVAPATMGLILSVSLWSYTLALIPFGLLIDRRGVRGIFGAAGLFWGGVTTLTATASGPLSMAFWRVLLGIGEAPMVPSQAKVIGVWAADGERGTMSAFGNIAGIPLGVFIGSPLIGWLLAGFGWRVMFVATGVVAIVWGIVWLAFYRDPLEHRGLSDGERRHLADNIRQLDAGRAVQEVGWGELARNRNVLGLALGQAALLYNLYFLLTWLPSYLAAQRHLTIAHTGVYGSIPWAFGLVGAVLGGQLSDRLIGRGWPVLAARKAVLASGLVLGMASLVSVAMTTLAGALACLSVATFGVLLANSVVWATSAEVTPARQGARTAAVINCVGNGGGLLAPLVSGILLQVTGSWTAPMAATAVAALAGSASYLLALSDRARFTAREPATSAVDLVGSPRAG